MSYRVTVEDPARVLDALERILGAHLLDGEGDVRARVRWYYRGGPAGPPVVFALRHGAGDDIVGTVALSPRPFRLEGRDVRAGLMGDFSVAPEHRTLFPALTLQRACRDHARETMAFSYGFPNKRAAPVLRRLGYRPVARRQRFTRVLHPDVYLSRRLRGSPLARAVAAGMHLGSRVVWRARGLVREAARVTWSADPPEGVDALWRRATAQIPVAGRRDASILRGRLAEQPNARVLFATLRDGGGAPEAVAAIDLGADGIARVRDFIATEEGAAALLAALPPALAARDMTAISITYAGGPALPEILARARFVPRSQEDHGEVLVDAGPRCPVPADRLRDASRWALFDADEDT